MTRRRVALALAGSLAATLVAVVLLARWSAARGLDALARVDLIWLALAVTLQLASWTLAGIRLRMLVRRADEPMRLRSAIRAHLLGLFASAATPSGTGGMPVVALATEASGVRRPVAWASAVSAAAADLLFFAWALPLSLGYLTLTGALPDRPGVGTTAVLASVLALAFFVLVTFRLGWARDVVGGLVAPRWPAVARRADRFLARLLEAQAFHRSAPVAWHLRLHATVAGAWVTLFTVAWALGRGVGGDVALTPVLAGLVITAGIGSLVPTPGGAGFYEAGATVALLSGGPFPGAVTAAVVWRLLSHYALFVIGPALGGTLLGRAASDE